MRHTLITCPLPIAILQCLLSLQSTETVCAGEWDSRSSAADHQCLTDEPPATIFEHSLLQSRASRFHLAVGRARQEGTQPAQKLPKEDRAYEPQDADRNFRDDVVEDHDNEIDARINGQPEMNEDVSLPGNLQEADEEDSDFAIDDYRAGSPERFCWIPPKADALGYLLDNDRGSVFAPIHIQCPPQCPFSQGIPEDKCFKACVTADQCRALHPFRVFGDNLTLQCTTTCGVNTEDFVEGCAECASTGICKKCSFWRSLTKDGRKCKDYWQNAWFAISLTGRLMFLVFLGFLVYIHFKPITSPGLLELASQHRELAQPWHIGTSEWGGGQTSVVCKHRLAAVTHEDNIAGMGTALYFRWLRFTILFAALLLPILYLTFHVSLEIAFVKDMEKFKAKADELPNIFGFVHASPDQTFDAAYNGERKQLLVLTEPELCRYSKGDPQYITNGVIGKETVNEGPAPILPAANKVPGQKVSLLEGNSTAGKPSMKTLHKVKLKLGIRPYVKLKLKSKAKMPILVQRDEPFDVPAGSFEKFPVRMTLALSFLYVLLTALSLAYARQQSLFEKRWRLQHRAHRDFAIFVSGLPADATDPFELQNFFQAALDSAPKIDDKDAKADSQLQVVAASVAYDHGVYEHNLKIWMELLVEKIEILLSKRFPDVQVLQNSADPESSGANMEFVPVPWYNLYERAACWFLPPLPEVEGWEDECREYLESIQCSGQAYIVVSSALARDRLLALAGQQLQWRPIGREVGGEPLKLSVCTAEPPSILWEAHGHVPSRWQIAQNVTLLLGTILCWALSFAPYAYYQIQVKALPGQELSMHADFGLGMLIAFGNNLVCLMIDITTHHFGLLDKETLDTFTLGLIYVATATNTVLDIAIVLLALRGLSLDLALHGTLDLSHYDRILAHELYTLLVPGYLITPYLFAPVLEDILPAFVKKRLIRSSRGTSKFAAEKKYERPKFDLAWHYSDLLTNVTVCLPLLMFGTHHMYAVVLCLLLCYCLTYAIDHFRLLRATTRTWQCSSKLDVAFSYWWSIPTGSIGAIALHWAIEARWIQPHRSLEKFMLVLYLLFHCICYCYAMRWLRCHALRKEDLDDGMSYDEMCKGHWRDFRFYDFVNTNPVQVLRSWLLPEKVAAKELVPFILGKEHFMLLDPVIGSQKELREAMLKRMEAAEENIRRKPYV